MLEMALIVAGFCWLIELMLVCRIEWYHRLMCSNSLLNVISSLFISYCISNLFFAHGIICLMAGAISAVASILTYKIMSFIGRYSWLRMSNPARNNGVKS